MYSAKSAFARYSAVRGDGLPISSQSYPPLVQSAQTLYGVRGVLPSGQGKKLSSVRLKAVDGDDQHTPSHLSGLYGTQRSEKETREFDKVVSDLCEGLKKCKFFGKFSPKSIPKLSVHA